jgi:hypothetical protein
MTASTSHSAGGLHLIEETTLHAGHADLPREAIDGSSGE